MTYQYVYLEIMLCAVGLWLVLFLFKKSQRQEMIFMGILGAIAGPLQELWYVKDYWHPAYISGWPWIEDMLFGFAFIGGAAVIYETVFTLKIKEKENFYQPHPMAFLSLVAIGAVGMAAFVPFVNSIYAAIISFIITWLIAMLLRPDLLKSSIYSAVLIMFIMFIGYEIVLFIWPGLVQAWWNLNNISNILIARIPLEEYLWFFSMGLAFGPLYEILKGSGFIKRGI